MDIQIEERVIRIQIVTVGGRIDAFNAPELRTHFQKLIEDGSKLFVLDLRRVDFMDSAAMAALVSLLKQARQAGGDVNMVAPDSEGARRILALTKFDRVFNMTTSVDEAVQKL